MRPDWPKWRAAAEVSLREAVALSLGHEPRQELVESSPEYRDRHFSALRALGNSLSAIWMPNDRPDSERVELSVFAAWAQDVGWELPPELADRSRADAARARAEHARPSRSDGLQRIVLAIVRANPSCTEKDVLAELRLSAGNPREGAVIETTDEVTVDDRFIRWRLVNGKKITTTPVSGLKDRVSRAKKSVSTL